MKFFKQWRAKIKQWNEDLLYRFVDLQNEIAETKERQK